MRIILFCGIFFVVTSLKAQGFQAEKMDSLFSIMEKHDKAMGSLSIYHKGESLYQKSIGYADVDEKIKSTVETKWRLGSIAKRFTATLVMQLIEEGKLSLETKLSDFYPELPNSDQITIQQLLRHETGIFDIKDSPNFYEWMLKERNKKDLLSKINENGFIFSPGEKRDYSNTNYILLTFIVEDIENEDFASILEKRILIPLHLNNTHYGEKTYPENFGSISYEKVDGVWNKVSGIHLSIVLGAAGIISTPEDINKFVIALFGGKLVTENSLVEIIKTVPFIEGVKIFGQTGGMDAFKSVLLYLPEQEMSLVLILNGLDYPLRNLMLGILKIALNMGYDLPQLGSEK
ncbi:MAG TPA: serine hydrolase domain-containing protein [Saprospiraceae bacterium]|nr:serine hydrolase domain-containing protein [Saprospiraceae bacterium]